LQKTPEVSNPTSFWNAFTPFSVKGPNTPSAPAFPTSNPTPIRCL